MITNWYRLASFDSMNKLREDYSNFGAPDCKRLRLDNDDNEPVAKPWKEIELNSDGAELLARENYLQPLYLIAVR